MWQDIAYPVLPRIPIAAPDRAVEGPPLAPVYHYPPHQHQRIRETERPLPPPMRHSPLNKRLDAVQQEGARCAVGLAGEAVWLLVCADGDTIVVVLGHDRSGE